LNERNLRRKDGVFYRRHAINQRRTEIPIWIADYCCSVMAPARFGGRRATTNVIWNREENSIYLFSRWFSHWPTSWRLDLSGEESAIIRQSSMAYDGGSEKTITKWRRSGVKVKGAVNTNCGTGFFRASFTGANRSALSGKIADITR